MTHWKENNFVPGDFYIICDLSGMKIKRSQARKQWNGLLVHKDWWEPRHPQQFVRGRKDRIVAEEPRPESDDYFVSTNEVKAEDL